MRLWSLHPKYLDQKGLSGAWREGLLAQACIHGRSKAYINHPQLIRFQRSHSPVKLIRRYLICLWKEGHKRGYAFNIGLILPAARTIGKIPVNDGQVQYESGHLAAKLKTRDEVKFRALSQAETLELNDVFIVTKGGIESWEKVG